MVKTKLWSKYPSGNSMPFGNQTANQIADIKLLDLDLFCTNGYVIQMSVILIPT